MMFQFWSQMQIFNLQAYVGFYFDHEKEVSVQLFADMDKGKKKSCYE